MGIAISDPPNLGLACYRAAVVALAFIEVPGTGFRPDPTSEFLWPRCRRCDRDRESSSHPCRRNEDRCARARLLLRPRLSRKLTCG